MELPGVGPIVAARVLADVGDVTRFADRNRFASWTGTAPIEASSGEVVRHRAAISTMPTAAHRTHRRRRDASPDGHASHRERGDPTNEVQRSTRFAWTGRNCSASLGRCDGTEGIAGGARVGSTIPIRMRVVPEGSGCLLIEC